MSVTCISNPWLKVDWKNTIASGDETIIYPAYCDAKGIDIADLPEPFSGNIDANVVFLNLNPGIGLSNSFFRFNKKFLQLTKKTLEHRIEKSLWDEDIRCYNEGLHDGCIWWRKHTKELRKVVSPVDLNVFVLEYFPYHTARQINYPKLPSDHYRNYLLCRAMNDGKLIVVLRGEKLWFGIDDNCCNGETIKFRLEKYKDQGNVILHSNSRSVYFTENSFAPNDWKRMVEELKKPIVQKHRIQ